MSRVLLTRYSVEEITAPSMDAARVEFQKLIALGRIKELSYQHPDGSWRGYGLIPQGFRVLIMQHECEKVALYFAINLAHSTEFSTDYISWGMDTDLPEGSLKWCSEEKRWIFYSNQR